MDIVTANITAAIGQSRILLFTHPGFILLPNLIFLCYKPDKTDNYISFKVDGMSWDYVQVNDNLYLQGNHNFPNGKLFANMNMLVVAFTLKHPFGHKLHLMDDNEHNASIANLENSLNNKAITSLTKVDQKPVVPDPPKVTTSTMGTTFYQMKPTSNKTTPKV